MKQLHYYFNESKNHYIIDRECSLDGYVEITQEQYNAVFNPEPDAKILRISDLKSLLSSTDYQAIKYAEGELSEEEYAPVREQRRAWRTEINQLEGELNESK